MQQTNWNEIYTKQSPKLLGICRRYIKNIATAEDIVQDSFIIAIQKENELKNKEVLNGWLSRIVINKALNYLKNEIKISFTSAENFEFIDETTMINTLEFDKKAAILAFDFSQENLLEAIDSLSENHKAVFNLYIIDQFSHLEISKLLKISVGTSKSSLSRARKNVQEYLLEKIKTKEKDENKKQRIIFFLFLGFGNQMFSQKFKKSFSTFEIPPKNQLDLSRKVESSMINFSTKSPNYFQFLKVGAVFIILPFLVFYYLKKEGTLNGNEKQTINNKELINDNSSTDLTKVEVVKTDSVTEKKIENNSINSEKVVSKNKVVVNSVQKQNTISSLQNKDSITKQETPKVVVIKKQIIKKDTIYVQK